MPLTKFQSTSHRRYQKSHNNNNNKKHHAFVESINFDSNAKIAPEVVFVLGTTREASMCVVTTGGSGHYSLGELRRHSIPVDANNILYFKHNKRTTS